MRVIGVDPGINPAVAVLDLSSGKVELTRIGDILENDGLDKLVAFFNDHPRDLTVIERVGPMPGQGLGSTARFMCAYGIIRGLVAGQSGDVLHVVPSVWKRSILPSAAFEETVDKGKRKDDQKSAAVTCVLRSFPQVSLIRSGCKVPDHNLAEALCLAAYGAKECYGEVVLHD